MSDNRESRVAHELVTLVVGLFCVSAFAAIGLVAVDSSWPVMLAFGLGGLALAFGASRSGVPRALVLVTSAFGVALTGLGVLLAVST